MCKIFATTLQGEAQDWFYTLPPQSIQSFDELSLVFTKEYSSYRSIKKKSNHLFNVKKNPNESLRDYVKRFKVEKAKIVGCNDSIARAAFQKRLPADHPLFRKLIMKEDLTLADSFALAEKHVLWDEACWSRFKDRKEYLTSPPNYPNRKHLFACLTVFEVVISSTNIREEMGARLVFHSSKALLDATRNSKANFGDSCCNSEAQVIPLDVRSHPHDALFRSIQTRDNKGAGTGCVKFFYERNNSTQKAHQGQTNTRRT